MGSGPIIISDAEDAPMLAKHKWKVHTDGYAVAFFYAPRDPSMPMTHANRVHRIIRMHRLVMKAEEGQEVDHINGNKLDNRKANLRLVTSSQNKINRGMVSYNKSGIKGVCFDKSRAMWLAYIGANNKKKIIGRFPTIELATQARKQAEAELHGEYARNTQ